MITAHSDIWSVLGWVVPLGVVAIVVVGITISFGLRIVRALFGGREFEHAPIGFGTIRAIDHTGITINDVPEYAIRLQVETPSGETFPATFKKLVDAISIASMKPGVVLPVAYLPGTDRASEVPVPRMAEAQHLWEQFRISRGLADPDGPRIVAQGIRGQGVVVSATPTGAIKHGEAQLELVLRVTRHDGSIFETRKHSYFPQSALARVAPGTVVDVFYLRDDESKFSMEVPVNA